MKKKHLRENEIENETEIKKANQLEQDIYRLMQLREQFQDDVKEVGAHITTLAQTNKRFVAHFDVFEEMAKKAAKNVEKLTQEAAYSMGKAAAEDFSELIKESLKQNINALNTSVRGAEHVLSETIGHKYRRLVLQCFIGSILFGLVCFGGGIYYAKQRLFDLPPDVFRMYFLGKQEMERALEKKRQEEEKWTTTQQKSGARR